MERLEDSFIPNLRPLFKTVISPFKELEYSFIPTPEEIIKANELLITK